MYMRKTEEEGLYHNIVMCYWCLIKQEEINNDLALLYLYMVEAQSSSLKSILDSFVGSGKGCLPVTNLYMTVGIDV
ncbi:hypothetical protein XENTR_v10012800 [Xenopus tropicalis]|nr:hypothetical protein XENTR_v10012800 [Xenopus tropicalis]